MSETMICTACHGPITDRAMKAADKLYHEDHFLCCVCTTSLKSGTVYTKNSELYCESDYMSKFVPVCARCDKYITQECVRAMDKTWHPEHFQCYGCLVQFSGSMSYREKDSHPYCDNCYTDTVLPKCGSCNKPITDRVIKALDTQWHVTCFVCMECKTTFEGSKNFYSVEGQPVCGPCYGVTDQ
eukprot:GFUD01098240.1.p1 GENE.GFUD01098240.1~~GFUD01098240.1.p1  ORF type:complete len:184 (-),score=40.61 GFUD01098240.1:20-571(-)